MEGQVTLEGYSNLEKIGEGGMAHVYRGIQDSLNRPVAIKVLTRELGDHDEARRRFERESFIIARLNHPNIIHVIDRGITPEGMPYFVMEYIEGIDLNSAVPAMELGHYDKLGIFVQLLKALSYAHKNNVIHRDIKPDNILVDADCNIKILDFGIAQFYEEEKVIPSTRTSHGTVMGTYNYMSPEQRESADNVTAKSDIYSVGVLMYKLFTDEVPAGAFPEPSKLNPDVTSELDHIILQCLKPDPDHRPDSAESLKIELLSIMQGAHIQSDQKQRAEQGITQIKSKFRLLDVLREDRFGAVYLYQQKESGKLLIIKKKRSTSTGFDTSSLFAALHHENIIPTLGTSKNDRFFILVQEYFSGGTLQDKLAYHLDWKETLRIGIQICQGMAFAHKNNIVHGHLRPTNILFSDEGEVKLTDFGLQDDVSDVKNAQFYSHGDEPKTQLFDIYSTGVVLYQLLTGCLPQQQESDEHTVRKPFTSLPGEIRELITKMLSTAPERRDRDSLQKCIEIFDSQLNGTEIKNAKMKESWKSDRDVTKITAPKPAAMDRIKPAAVKEKPAVKPEIQEEEAAETKSAVEMEKKTPTEIKKKSPEQINKAEPEIVEAVPKRKWFGKNARMLAMFGVLILVFSQYLLFFDGHRKLTESMPQLYDQFTSNVGELFGR